MIKKIFKITLILIIVLTLLAAGGYYYLSENTYKAMPVTYKTMAQENVVVDDGLIVINPPAEPIANLVFYPGGLVENQAYVILGDLLSKQGIRVFIPKMPFNLSILSNSEFEKVYEKYKDDKKWYIGGHSLGGASASIYAAKNPGKVAGVIFLGAYPSDTSNLAKLDIPVLSMIGTFDVLVDKDKYVSTKTLLPADTQYVVIEGGNHSYYGYYGMQKDDMGGTITRWDQHNIVVQNILGIIIPPQ